MIEHLGILMDKKPETIEERVQAIEHAIEAMIEDILIIRKTCTAFKRHKEGHSQYIVEDLVIGLKNLLQEVDDLDQIS